MRVLNVNIMIGTVTGGGMEERTFQMSRSLVRAGVECIILTTDLGLTAERIKNLSGIEVFALPCLIKRFYIPKVSFARIYNIIKRVDIIHLMGHWSFLNALVYFYARFLNKPYVVCSAGALPIYGRSKLFKRVYNLLVGNRIIKNADGFIAITEKEITHFEAYGVGAENVSIIPNGINPEDYVTGDIEYFRAKYGLGDYPFILFLGRLNLIKGPDMLLCAFCRVKDSLLNYRLIFAGSDEGMLTKLKNIAMEAGLRDRVYFLGHLGNEDKTRALRCAELLVIPSRSEAMSIVVLEAGIAGKPVLLTNQCGFNDVGIINGGLVVEASVEGLQRGLVEILKDRSRLKLMGNNLQNYVRSHYTWNTVINEYLNLYNMILRRKNNDHKYK